MEILACPKCQGKGIVKSGVIKDRQRYLCKKCNYYFNDSEKLVKIEEYLRNGKLDQTINLRYKNNKFDCAFIGLDNDSKDDWFSNYYSNIEQYNDFLTTKNIKIDNPLMLSNEVSDIQNLLANIESFQKIKKEKLTIFQSKNVNLKIRFDPSTITRFIPQNSGGQNHCYCRFYRIGEKYLS